MSKINMSGMHRLPWKGWIRYADGWNRIVIHKVLTRQWRW